MRQIHQADRFEAFYSDGAGDIDAALQLSLRGIIIHHFGGDPAEAKARAQAEAVAELHGAVKEIMRGGDLAVRVIGIAKAAQRMRLPVRRVRFGGKVERLLVGAQATLAVAVDE